MGDPFKFMMFATAATATVVLVKVIANTVVRATELARRPTGVDEAMIRERLERIEVAVDTIAIEVERLGEHQRFNAQLALNRPEPLPPKVVTPH